MRFLVSEAELVRSGSDPDAVVCRQGDPRPLYKVQGGGAITGMSPLSHTSNISVMMNKPTLTIS